MGGGSVPAAAGRDGGGVRGHGDQQRAGGLVLPGMLGAWQRTPQELQGDWWRTVTALLVQDGGVVGTLSNLAFLEVRFRAEPRSPCLVVLGGWRS